MKNLVLVLLNFLLFRPKAVLRAKIAEMVYLELLIRYDSIGASQHYGITLILRNSRLFSRAKFNPFYPRCLAKMHVVFQKATF